MSAYPISWHQECLNNSTQYAARERKRIEAELARIVREENDNEFYQYQIIMAREKGKTSFDRERFLANEKKKDLE